MSASLPVRLAVLGVDARDTDDAVTGLLGELTLLPVDGIARPPVGDAPDGTRAGELVALGGVLLTLAGNPEVVTSVLSGLWGWLDRRGRGRIEVRIGEQSLTLDSSTPEERAVLIAAYVDRVLGR
ncbi:hypothetical protein Lfu02_59540 [Longispora fulva]|uniref:Uncharacterized protein n=1 Tax=Longispora fulva TaxID=619741 RepID=A0A8J7GE68_9ACTN|nr:hypothetical protein [Longispora fulva]MBG6137064.1 hypothetical protein [Longispora fulva]GIG61582.1 hypothetical protein Lfu02_59540 [Longispora fulva]